MKIASSHELNNGVPSSVRFTFQKEERLSKKKLIDELFKSGSSFYLHPFKILWLEKAGELPFPAQVLISVSNKNFPNAVDRNAIKRMTREVYRQHKHKLYESLDAQKKKMVIGLVYASRKKEPFELIREKIIAILRRLSENNALAEKNTR